MPLPKIDEANRKKPLSYDAQRGKFLLYDDIVSGKETIVPIDRLSEADLKKLVVERQRTGPDYRVQAMSGSPLSRDDVIRAIERDEPFGRMTVEAERSYLQEFLAEIQGALSS
jgi:hypothetical protein